MSSKIKYIEIIGSGGYGEVWKAILPNIKGDVAVKELTYDTVKGIERFKREVLLLSRLKHPNIIPIFDYQLEKAPYWFAMPLASGNLSDDLSNLSHDIGKLHDIFLQILHGMIYAHDQNIIHRDLKPQNILIFGDSIYISDFGLGKRIDRTTLHTTLTGTGQQLGTITYAAPEQMKDFKRADKRSDIYSLGRMLYYVLTGEEPFPDMDLDLVNDKYRHIVGKCTRRNPDNRFQTITELLEAFSEVSDDTLFSHVKRADELMEEIFLKPIGTDVIDKIDRIFSENIDNFDLYRDHFPELRNGYLDIYINERLVDFKRSLTKYDSHVFSGISFGYCDVIADLYKEIFHLTNDLDVQKLLLNRLLIIGVSNNRFYVWDVIGDLLEGISDTSTAFIAKEVLEQNQDEALFLKEQLLERPLLKILKDTLNSMGEDEDLDDIDF